MTREAFATGESPTTPVIDQPVRIVPYDGAWPQRFEEECVRLEAVLAPWLAAPVEHVGSTAVPGLAAKPVIDIMAGIHDLPSALAAREALVALDYVYFPYRPEVMHWFCKPSPARRTHHLHLVAYGGPLWKDRILFRDYLRRSPSTASEYAALKRALAVQHPRDREAYTGGKAEFIRCVLDQARATR